MAKMTATETAQQVIDRAVQLFGGRGVARGEVVERLYRDIRALRIYEGATEVQKLIIGRELIQRRRGDTKLSLSRNPAARGLAAPLGLQQRRAGAGPPGVHRRPGGLGPAQRPVRERARSPSRRLRRCRNVLAVLAQADGGPEHIARMTWYLTSRAEYLAHLKEIGAAYRAVMGKHFPAMTAIEVTALIEAQAKVEIEATAVIP